MKVGDFVGEVMKQLSPFLEKGSHVHFSIYTDAFFEKRPEWTVLIGGNNKIEFTAKVGEATEHIPEN